jgi:hypothetical protein
MVGTLRKNKPEIPALFLSGKQRDVYSSVFGFTYDLPDLHNRQPPTQSDIYQTLY